MASSRDKNVLNMILNPLMPTGDAIDEPDDDDEAACRRDEQGERRNAARAHKRETMRVAVELEKLPGYAESRQLEIEGVRLSEADDHERAVERFDAAIAACPRNPSAFNNRAQEKQFLRRADGERRELRARH